MEWEMYDPTWLVDLAREQKQPEWLIEAMEKCTRFLKETEAYIRFVPEEQLNEYRLLENITLNHPQLGTLVLDIATSHSSLLPKKVVTGLEIVEQI